MAAKATVWMMPPWGEGAPVEVEGTPEILGPMMVAGWSQCGPPANAQEEKPHVDD